jgi:hypothetical protein
VTFPLFKAFIQVVPFLLFFIQNGENFLSFFLLTA